MVMTEQRPETQGRDDPDVQVLFPEARARRRRLRIAIGLAIVFAVAISAVATDRSGVFGNTSAQATGAPGSPVTAGHEHISSVLFTETRQVPESKQSLLFDSTPLVKMVVDTTLGSNAPTVDYEGFYTSWTRHPTVYSRPAGIEKNGVIFAPNPAASARLQICTASTGGRKICSVTTKRWIEEPSKQVRPAAAASATTPQNLYDPTKLFGELRATVGKLVRIGTSQIGGVATTEYLGNIPAQNSEELHSAAIAEQTVLRFAVPGDTYASYGGEHGGQLQRSVTVSFKSVPLEVWVDSQGVVRQVRVATQDIGFALGNLNQFFVVPLTVTLDYASFNKPVALPAIPAQDVFVVHGKIVSEQALSGRSTD